MEGRGLYESVTWKSDVEHRQEWRIRC